MLLIKSIVWSKTTIQNITKSTTRFDRKGVCISDCNCVFLTHVILLQPFVKWQRQLLFLSIIPISISLSCFVTCKIEFPSHACWKSWREEKLRFFTVAKRHQILCFRKRNCKRICTLSQYQFPFSWLVFPRRCSNGLVRRRKNTILSRILIR